MNNLLKRGFLNLGELIQILNLGQMRFNMIGSGKFSKVFETHHPDIVMKYTVDSSYAEYLAICSKFKDTGLMPEVVEDFGVLYEGTCLEYGVPVEVYAYALRKYVPVCDLGKIDPTLRWCALQVRDLGEYINDFARKEGTGHLFGGRFGYWSDAVENYRTMIEEFEKFANLVKELGLDFFRVVDLIHALRGLSNKIGHWVDLHDENIMFCLDSKKPKLTDPIANLTYLHEDRTDVIDCKTKIEATPLNFWDTLNNRSHNDIEVFLNNLEKQYKESIVI